MRGVLRVNHTMIAASVSMAALQRKLDLIAENIANIGTVGYKSKDAAFAEVLSAFLAQEPDFARDGRRTPLGLPLGGGARVVGILTDLSPGSPQETGVPTDLMLEGNFLFELQTDEGERRFTRHGAFQWRIENILGDLRLVSANGLSVVNTDDEPVIVPAGYEFRVGSDGTMTAVSPDGTDVVDLGTLKTVEPVRPEFLRPAGENLFAIPEDVNPDDVVRLPDAVADGTAVSVRQGFLEASNVDPTREMTELTAVLRAYQLNARALSSGDQMLQLAANLRGG